MGQKSRGRCAGFSWLSLFWPSLSFGSLFLLAIPAKAGIQLSALSSSRLEVQSFVSPAASRLLFGIAQKVTKKARRRTRCPAARHARRGVPALLAFAGSLRRHSPCAASRSRQSLAATLRADPAKAAMLGTANGAGIHESVHPCTTLRHWVSEPPLSLLLLRQDAAQTGCVFLWKPRSQEKTRAKKSRWIAACAGMTMIGKAVSS